MLNKKRNLINRKINCNLNTSHVNVKYKLSKLFDLVESDLNTSHVNVKLACFL